ncbi:putative Ig domain-containing protein [Steroidobacter sp.]|uniref:putative Ig domain-containing protein n=1 Tax=Steroidobacter sp. TaxID=1978227 RepID=UPI001A4BCBDB|nr:putative Ig domain-containing protein [Steroidobacter sp.]MBL8271192.1 fibronectin type III domain-containing protein [Steroidobacter sp.]
MRTSTQRTPMVGVSALFFALVCALSLLSSVVHAAPTITGSPKTTFGTNSWYSFLPTANDPAVAKSTLRYSIVNKPSWALFSVYSGRLEGATPATPGTYSNIRITVRSSTGTATLPAFSIQVVPKTTTSSGGSTTNRAPTVSGTPATSVTAGSAYSFRPTGTDPEGTTLTWSITNRPTWATFSTTTGALTGTPTAAQVGSYSGIVITASDGTNRTSLASFNIAVNAAGSSTGAATLSWTPPTRNTDGSTLTNLSGYRIYYGTSASSLTRTITVSNAGVTNYVVSDLTAATWYFSVRAYTSSGSESLASNTISKVVR